MQNLDETIQQEKAERAAIKNNLKKFHEAVNARETELAAEIEKRHRQRMAELEAQENLLNELLKA